MRTYAQYCPIARTSEVLARRWTPIIIRDLLGGPTTYTSLADGAPGPSRSLLEWAEGLRSGRIQVTGSRHLARSYQPGIAEASGCPPTTRIDRPRVHQRDRYDGPGLTEQLGGTRGRDGAD